MTEKAVDNKKENKRKFRFAFTRRWFAAPYMVFIAVFVLFPMILLLFNAFIDNGSFSFENFKRFFFDTEDFTTFSVSVLIAVISTALCLLIAYPVAFIMAQTKLFKKPYMLILLFILPMWINFLLRIYALREVLDSLKVTSGWGAIVLGMVYDFLPFMILPIYTSLSKMDKSYLEASADLGANKRQVFFKTVVPLSMPGIMSGITMVFVPIMSAYAISDVLSGEMLKTIGRVFWDTKTDTGYLAVMSLIMSVFIVVLILVSSRYERIGGDTGGAML